MDELSEAFIDECLKYQQFSDYDSEGDSSSDCRSELDDEYYQIIEKPIPVDELIRNTINSFHFEQCDSNLASCHQDNSAVAVANIKSSDYVDYRPFGYEDEAKEKTNDVAELNSFCQVRKKKRRQKIRQEKMQDFQATSNNPYDNNMYNCLLNKEDIVTEEENEEGKEEINNDNEVNQIRTEICIEPQPTHKETEMGNEKESGTTQDKSSKKKKKKKKKTKKKEANMNNSTAAINNINSNKEIDENPIKAVRRPTLEICIPNSQKPSGFGASSGSMYQSSSLSQQYYKPSSAMSGFVPCKTAFELGDLLFYTRQFSGGCYPGIRSIALENKVNNIPTTKIRTSPIKNNKHTASWILHKEALLKPEKEITEDTPLSSIANRKRLLKNIQCSHQTNATLRDSKKGKKQKYYDDSNLHSWRVSPSTIHSLSSIIAGFINKYETEQNIPNGGRLQEDIFTLPIKQQTKIFPILHQIPKVMATDNESIHHVFENMFSQFSQAVLRPFLPNCQKMDRKELVQNIGKVFRDDFAFAVILTELQRFGLKTQQNLFGVALEFEITRFGVWVNVETTDNLKYSTSRFRVICK